MSENGNEKTEPQEKVDKILTGIQEEQKKIDNNIENITKELTNLKNCIGEKTSALEKKIDQFKMRVLIGCGLGLVVLLLFILFFCFMCFSWVPNHALAGPDAAVFISLVVGIVAIVITALVMLTRRNSED